MPVSLQCLYVPPSLNLLLSFSVSLSASAQSKLLSPIHTQPQLEALLRSQSVVYRFFDFLFFCSLPRQLRDETRMTFPVDPRFSRDDLSFRDTSLLKGGSMYINLLDVTDSRDHLPYQLSQPLASSSDDGNNGTGFGLFIDLLAPSNLVS